jgi:hypothetical protein
MFRKLVSLLLLLCLFTQAKLGYAQDPNTTAAKVKAVFIYNFTKYIEWPPEYKQGNFVITIVGYPVLAEELNKMAQKNKSGAQPFTIQHVNSVSEVGKCHILYLGPGKTSGLVQAIEKVKKHSTLVITEGDGCTKKGAAINFVFHENKQKFELNKTNAGNHKLLVSSNLASLAIIVE